MVFYKPGKNNILADALSRRPDYDPQTVVSRQVTDDDEYDDRCATCVSLNLTRVTPELRLTKSSRLTRTILITRTLSLTCALPVMLHWELYHEPSVIIFSDTVWTKTCFCIASINAMLLVRCIANDMDLRARIIHEYHDASAGGRLGRESLFAV